MRTLYFLIITLGFLTNLSGQDNIFQWHGIILSESDSKEIPFAHCIIKPLNKPFLLFISGDKGDVTIKYYNYSKNDSIFITCIGYKTYKNTISSIKDTLFLSPESYIINEVTVVPKKSKLKTLGNKASFTIRSSQLLFNFCKVIYIPNEDSLTGKIIKIRYYMHDFLDSEFQYRPFNVKLFKTDENSDLPGAELLKDELIVMLPRNKGKWLEVDISHFNIEFPEQGIFVGLEALSEEFYLSNGYITSSTINDGRLKNRINSLSIGYTAKKYTNSNIVSWDYNPYYYGWTKKHMKNRYFLIQIIVKTYK